jgi:hypothetical protein
MRFFEFGNNDVGVDKFVIALRNHIGRASSMKAPAKLNWNAIAAISRANGFEFGADYETFKAMYDSNPVLQTLVKDFNNTGIELNVPGAPEDKNSSGTQDSQSAVDQAAASAAPQQLSQSQQVSQA